MSRFNTGNPLDSDDLRDLSDNAKNFDQAINSEAETFVDRKGRTRLSWARVEELAEGAMPDIPDAPRIATESERADTLINDAEAAGGWDGVDSAQQEFAARYEGSRFAATDVGECFFQLPTFRGLAGIIPMTGMFSHRGQNIRAIPVSPRVRLMDTPIAKPLFAPVVSSEYGFCVFKFLGEKPLYATLEGSINMLVRHANEPAAGRVNTFYLRLEQFNAPELEDGQNSGNKYLASCSGVISDPREFAHYMEVANYCNPINQSALNNAGTNGDIWPGPPENGWIASNSREEALETEFEGDPVGPQFKTTQWFNVSAMRRRVFYFNFQGRSSRFRVQIKRDDGSIYFDPQSGNVTSNRLFRSPPDASEMRIYYSGPNDDVVDGSEEIRVIGPQTGFEFNVASGVWAEHTAAIRRDVVFWPGAEYAIRIFGEVRNGSSFRPWGFIYQGGGISFRFDAKEMRRQIGDNLYDNS